MSEKKSFITTLPGILTGVGGLIGAVVGLLTLLYQMGIIGTKSVETKSRSRQAHYEEKLSQLDQQELIQRQEGLEMKLREMEEALNNERENKRKNKFITKPEEQYFNIGGAWQGTGGLSYIIGQSGSAVTIQEISPIYGVTSVGKGIMTGKDVDISYSTAMGTMGRVQLRLNEDGRQLKGMYQDLTTMVSMPLVLYR